MVRPGSLDYQANATFEYHVRMHGGKVINSKITSGDRNIFLALNESGHVINGTDVKIDVI